VGVSTDFLQRYPFELSGGMRQRVVLAMALVTEPDVVILDEPTSALDVLTQASIMNVLKRIKREEGTSFILITHDVATSSELGDRVALMYAGRSSRSAMRGISSIIRPIPTRRCSWTACPVSISPRRRATSPASHRT